MKRVAYLLLLCCFAIGAAAPRVEPKKTFKDPDGFGGLKWGASLSEAEKIFRVWEQPWSRSKGERETQVTAWVRLGEMNLESKVTFLDDRFVQISALVDVGQKPTLEAAFVQRYGPPTTTIENAKIWRGEKVEIVLNSQPVKLGGNVYAGHMILTHADYRQYKQQTIKEGADKTAKDL